MLFAIAIASMGLASLRPWRVREWVWPLAGAVLIVLLGFQPVARALVAIGEQWNVALFIFGLMGIAAAAEESGAFAWITEVLLERAGGSRRRLFVAIFLAGAAMTLLLSNDATAIVLTPVVFRAVSKRAGDAMPYLLACTFVADTASFGLPFANPANVLILPHPQLWPYLVHLGPPQIAAIAVNLLLMLAMFGSRLDGRYDVPTPQAPSKQAVRTTVAMLAVAFAYLVAVALGVPLGPVAIAGAILACAAGGVTPRAAARHVSWSTFVLLASLFVLLDAVARAGLVTWTLHAFESVSHAGALAIDALAAGGAALASNLFNNLPIAVASAYVAAQAPNEHLSYPLIVGVDLGPNLTTMGSLATILWAATLRKRGLIVDPVQYLQLGIVIVPATITVTILWLFYIQFTAR